MSGLFGGSKPKPPPPPAVMPDPDDSAIQDAKRRRTAEQLTRTGRVSTIMSDGGYSGEKLGG